MFKSIGLATPLALAVLCFAATTASAATAFSDSFESQQNTRDWQVYDDAFGDWYSTMGAGIEVQTSGVVVDARHGNQYIELDSDKKRGGDASAATTNSSMTRKLALGAGTYSLDWFYQSRTESIGDNAIDIYLSTDEENLLSILIGGASGTGRTGWIEQNNLFTIDGTGEHYFLTFKASGVANTLGGFIDHVSLTQVPLPGGLPMLLAGAAALGFVGRRKRRRVITVSENTGPPLPCRGGFRLSGDMMPRCVTGVRTMAFPGRVFGLSGRRLKKAW